MKTSLIFRRRSNWRVRTGLFRKRNPSTSASRVESRSKRQHAGSCTRMPTGCRLPRSNPPATREILVNGFFPGPPAPSAGPRYYRWSGPRRGNEVVDHGGFGSDAGTAAPAATAAGFAARGSPRPRSPVTFRTVMNVGWRRTASRIHPSIGIPTQVAGRGGIAAPLAARRCRNSNVIGHEDPTLGAVEGCSTV